MILRGVLALGLTALLLNAPACGVSDGPSDGSSRVVDDPDSWGADETPATRKEILAAPAEHSADALAEALVQTAEEADSASLPSVLAITTDDREEIRWHAVLALKAIGGPQADEALAQLAANDPSELVRDEAATR